MSITLLETLRLPAVTSSVRSLDGAAVAVLTDQRDLERFAGAWHRLAAGREATAQFGWVHACAANLVGTDQLRIVVLHARGELLAAAPLYRQRRFGIEHWAVLGVDELYEPTDLPSRDPAAGAALLDALVGSGRPLLLQRLPGSSALLGALVALSPRRARVERRAAPPAPTIRLGPDWIEPAARLPPRRRADLRRAQRRARAAGTLRSTFHAPGPGEVDALFDAAVAVEARSWKGRAGTALLHDARRHAFFRRWARAAAQDGSLRIGLLRLGDAVAAMQIAAVTGDAYALLKIGYDDAYARCSPGVLLMHDAIRHAACQGLRRFELLGLDAPWLKPWTREHHDCFSVRVYPRNALAALAFAASSTAGALRRVRRP